LGIDIVEASAVTSDGYKYILTCYCLFSRWAIAVPLRTKTAAEVGTAIYNDIVFKLGTPVTFLSDNGREFVNAGLRFINGRWGIHHTTTGGYQSQALPTERWHRWLNHMMTALSSQFGLAWNTYMQAVVWNYNISTCVSTGYSPYELMFGRVPSYLHDLPFTRKPSQRAANHDDWGRDLVARNAAIYKLVRVNQAKIAAANQARSNLNKATVTFTAEDKENDITGDLVLFWEPQQTKMLKDDSASVLDASKAPKKWTPVWTGPHAVVEKISANQYRIFHRKRAERVKTHVNRLVIFHPWSTSVVSTSEWEGIHAYRTGEWANEGALIIVPLLPPHPFGVAKLTKANRDGSIEFQWWTNEREDIRSTIQPGWISGQGKNGEPIVYYHYERKDEGHPPFMGHVDLPMTQKDIVVHSFELTAAKKVPMVVLKAVDEDYRIWWTMEPMNADVPDGARHETTIDADAPNGARHETTIDADAPNGARHETMTARRIRAPNGARHETMTAKRTKAVQEYNASMMPRRAAPAVGYTGTGMTLRNRKHP
jgi:hypothetical protein